LFEAAQYMQLVEAVLWSSRRRLTVATDGFHVFGSLPNWTVITWKASVTFDSGHELEIYERYNKDADGKMLFGFNYHFMDGAKNCIFRFDTHGYEFPFGEPCHVHLGADEVTMENGDGRLCGFGLENIDFLAVFRLAYRQIKGRRLPWE
jgi:hypothetical protein